MVSEKKAGRFVGFVLKKMGQVQILARKHQRGNKMTRKSLRNSIGLAAAVAMATISFSANAAIITVDSTDFWQLNGSPVLGTFNASGSDKLVVIVTGEHGNPGWVGDVTAVTYNGQTLVQAVDRDAVPGIGMNPLTSSTDQTFNDIWFLDNPGDFAGTGQISATVGSRGHVTVFGISGTRPGVGATAISGPASRSVDLTTTADDSLVIASFGLGGNGNTAASGSITADSPLTLVSRQHVGNNWSGHATGAAQVPTAGLGTYSFTNGDASGANVIAAEFLAIPEPSTAALFGLGALGLFLRRRR